MAENEQQLYIGIDLNDSYAMISFATKLHPEPDTVSSVAGSELFQIPLAVCYVAQSGQWAYGDEAIRFEKAEMGTCERCLLSRSLERDFVLVQDQTFELRSLLAVFIKKILLLAGKLGPKISFARVVFTFAALNPKLMELMEFVFAQLPVERNRISVMDYKKSFYFYALNQKDGLSTHDVVLFQYYGKNIICWYLMRAKQSKPQLVQIVERDCGYLTEQKDNDFADLIPGLFKKKIVSSIYLVGEGFEGGWMQHSLRVLCQGRRAFLGKNLFTKGACYAAEIFGGLIPWEYAYMGENEMKFNISLKVRKNNEMAFHTLISAGENWYEAHTDSEIILDGPGEIDFWLQMPNSRQARIETLELTNLPARPRKTTRLRIQAKPLSDRSVRITITDLGLGEFFKASGMIWEHVMKINDR
ncbi:MAG: hypothetical protein HFH35_11105 [Eubacterium sp.]|nr:hypothetical protein [Eubacterium sp.]